MTFDEIVSRLEGLKKTGKSFVALCPAHDDGKQSLSIAEGDGGRVLLKCFAGCPVEAILSAIGLEMKDLFTNTNTLRKLPLTPYASRVVHTGNGSGSTSKTITEIYEYTDRKGKLVYENVRYSPKGFRQRRPDGKGGYIYNLEGVVRVPYRLPELLSAVSLGTDEIWYTEGEKDADNLRSLGFTATSFKTWSQGFNSYIDGTRSVLLADHDKSGKKQAEESARIIAQAAKSIKIIDLYEGEPLPDKHGKDVSDWIDERRTAGETNGEIAESLVAIAEAADTWRAETASVSETPESPPAENQKLAPLQSVWASDIEAQDVRWLWEPYLAYGAFSLIDGIEGIGKTWLMLDKTGELTRAGHKVLLILAEDALAFVVKPRLEMVGADCERVAIIKECFALDEDGTIRLSHKLADIRPSLVVIDPLFARVGNIDLNKDNQIKTVTNALNDLAEAYDCSVVGIRHIGKSKGLGEARAAGLNGVGWRAGARTAMLVGCDPNDEDRRAFVQTKNNLAPVDRTPLGFEIRGDRFEWTGECDLTAERMLAFRESATGEERGARGKAVKFLKETLANGAVGSADLMAAAMQEGIKKRTLDRAKSKVARSVKDATFSGGWRWELLEDCHEDCQKVEVGNLCVVADEKARNYGHSAEDCQNLESGNLRGNLGTNGNGHIVPWKPCIKCGEACHPGEVGICIVCEELD